MRIEEIIKSCANEAVAAAAVSSIGRGFSREVRDVAGSYGMSLGGFTAFSVSRFAGRGDESEMRTVRAAMAGSPEPLLTGLHRILCFALAAGVPVTDRRPSARSLVRAATRGSCDADARREWVV